MLKSTLTNQGQTTLPPEVRKSLGLQSGQSLAYEICPDGVLIRPEGRSLMDSAGSLRSDQPAAPKQVERQAVRWHVVG